RVLRADVPVAGTVRAVRDGLRGAVWPHDRDTLVGRLARVLRMMMPRKKLLLLIALVALVAAYFAFDLGRYLHLDYIKQRQADLAALYADKPVQVIGAFFAIYVAVTALSLPGPTIITLAAGAIFGLHAGRHAGLRQRRDASSTHRLAAMHLLTSTQRVVRAARCFSAGSEANRRRRQAAQGLCEVGSREAEALRSQHGCHRCRRGGLGH